MRLRVSECVSEHVFVRWHLSCAGGGVRMRVSARMHVGVSVHVSARMRVGVSVSLSARMRVSVRA